MSVLMILCLKLISFISHHVKLRSQNVCATAWRCLMILVLYNSGSWKEIPLQGVSCRKDLTSKIPTFSFVYRNLKSYFVKFQISFICEERVPWCSVSQLVPCVFSLSFFLHCNQEPSSCGEGLHIVSKYMLTLTFNKILVLQVPLKLILVF